MRRTTRCRRATMDHRRLAGCTCNRTGFDVLTNNLVIKPPWQDPNPVFSSLHFLDSSFVKQGNLRAFPGRKNDSPDPSQRFARGAAALASRCFCGFGGSGERRRKSCQKLLAPREAYLGIPCAWLAAHEAGELDCLERLRRRDPSCWRPESYDDLLRRGE